MRILQGSTDSMIKQYEVLTDYIKEFKGKTPGSQSHIPQNNSTNSSLLGSSWRIKGRNQTNVWMFETFTKNEIEI